MSTAEKTVYLPLEHRAKAFYRDFLSRNSKKATKNSVRLFQKLVPLRVACSSGTCLSSHDEGARDQSASKPNSQNGANEYESVFKSKFDVLVAELKKIRSNHPSGKYCPDRGVHRPTCPCSFWFAPIRQEFGFFTVFVVPQEATARTPDAWFPIQNLERKYAHEKTSSSSTRFPLRPSNNNIFAKHQVSTR